MERLKLSPSDSSFEDIDIVDNTHRNKTRREVNDAESGTLRSNVLGSVVLNRVLPLDAVVRGRALLPEDVGHDRRALAQEWNWLDCGIREYDGLALCSVAGDDASNRTRGRRHGSVGLVG